MVHCPLHQTLSFPFSVLTSEWDLVENVALFLGALPHFGDTSKLCNMVIFTTVWSKLVTVTEDLVQLWYFLSLSFPFIKLISASVNTSHSPNFICSVMDLLFRCQDLKDFGGKQTISKDQDFAECKRKLCFEYSCSVNDRSSWLMTLIING